MSNKFKIDGSLNVENLVVENNLNVKGATQTINQETLTVKDNLIAVNGNGTTLDTAEMAGVVAITGKQHINLKDGNYVFNYDKIIEKFNTSVRLYNPEFDEYELVMDEAFAESISDLGLIPKAVNNIPEDYKNDFEYYYPNNVYGYVAYMRGRITAYLKLNTPNNSDICVYLVSIVVNELSGTITTSHFPTTMSFYFENQIANNISLLKEILLKEDGSKLTDSDFVTKYQAYAAPIYDVEDDSLKIGLGSYEKDENEDIKSFTFGAGQGQSIATRADSIKEGNVLIWGANNKIIDSGKSLSDVDNSNHNINLSGYQTKTDSGLNTTSKYIVGAINEVKSKIDQVGSSQGGGTQLYRTTCVDDFGNFSITIILNKNIKPTWEVVQVDGKNTYQFINNLHPEDILTIYFGWSGNIFTADAYFDYRTYIDKYGLKYLWYVDSSIPGFEQMSVCEMKRFLFLYSDWYGNGCPFSEPIAL